MEYIILSVSLAGIVFGADFLVSGAVAIARRFKVSDFVIGAAIVGVGTKGKITRTFGIFLFSAFVMFGVALGIKPSSFLDIVLLFNPAIFDPVIWDHNGGMVVITAWWGVWHIISGMILAYLWRARGLFDLSHSA